jgi:hypothetical protein
MATIRTTELHVWISEIGKADPHHGHLLGYFEVCFAVRSAQWVRVAVLRVAVAFGVILRGSQRWRASMIVGTRLTKTKATSWKWVTPYW